MPGPKLETHNNHAQDRRIGYCGLGAPPAATCVPVAGDHPGRSHRHGLTGRGALKKGAWFRGRGDSGRLFPPRGPTQIFFRGFWLGRVGAAVFIHSGFQGVCPLGLGRLSASTDLYGAILGRGGIPGLIP